MPEVDHVERRRLHETSCIQGCYGFPVADVHPRKDVNMQDIIAKNGSETLEPVKAQVKGEFMRKLNMNNWNKMCFYYHTD